jgi:hypothetical protein
MFRLRSIAILTTAVFLSAFSFAGTKYAVGTCEPKLTFYTTISQAVSSVPPGSTIVVCPGSYPEQVLITQPLILEGVIGGSSDAVIVVPSGGLVDSIDEQNIGIVYYQVLVQTAGPVNITNLAVDGTGGANGDPLAGIFYLDSSGTVSDVSARNQTSDNGGVGFGIVVATSAAAAQAVTIQNSVVRGFDGDGIYAIAGNGPLTTNFKANTIHASAGSSADITIFGSSGTLQSNEVSGGVNGLVLVRSTATVTANTISDNGTANGAGVFVYFGSNSIKGNKIDAGGQGGVSLNDSGTASLVGNTIVNSSTAVNGCGGFLQNPASGYTVTGNIITDATVGVQMPSGNMTTPNTFYAVASAVASCN